MAGWTVRFLENQEENECKDLTKSLITESIICKQMAKKEFSFSEAVKEIEEILKQIESGELDVDKLAVEVKRASELISLCQKKLRTTEEEINNIFRELA